nr:homeobox transcriptional repressor [Paracentrotus lividus]
MATRLSSIYYKLKKQNEILEAEFCINTRPDITTRDRLAQTLKISNIYIHVWFQNRRLRLRRSPTRRAEPQPISFYMNDRPIDLSVSGRVQRSIDIHHSPVDLSVPNKTSQKRKSACDVTDIDMTSPPSEKPATISAPMTSSSYHPSGVGAIQHRASRDTPNGATSSLMSVDFLSRSSRISPSKP